jgi:hypothetical protein
MSVGISSVWGTVDGTIGIGGVKRINKDVMVV